MRRKTLLWVLLLVLLTLYGLVVYSWWVEGNSNSYRQRMEADHELQGL